MTRILGAFARDGDCAWNGAAADVLLDLSEDRDPEVRYNAVYFGLTPVPPTRRETVIRRLVEMAMFDRHSDMPRRITWGLQRDTDSVAKLLDEALRGPSRERAEAARSVYKELTGRTPPASGPASPEVRKAYVKAFRDLYDHLGKVYPSFAIKGIDWAQVGRELLPRAEAVKTEEQFGLLVEELVARLEDSHAFVQAGSATPPPPPACRSGTRGWPA